MVVLKPKCSKKSGWRTQRMVENSVESVELIDTVSLNCTELILKWLTLKNCKDL